ncbi:bifunctional alpha,alpha-trehalose-phosphate synthase (UDP-forming)/trehalose-phosphatase [Nibrella saemangeumensis]|uniref:Bifunctional alpha,alpha-trehalose-phosphate synthase (UDP-forming)/trehalose-phosphatase n=1 Tax=Nibrella saemangeumensis TaxID=1084526 RepID=A0ABP8MWP4_9BACT
MTLHPTKFKRLLIVSYRLPFAIMRTEEGLSIRQNSGGLVSAVLSMAERMGNSENLPFEKIHWIGHSDADFQDVPPALLENDNFVVHPVYLDPELNRGFYEGFCNDCIWPLFHYFTSYASFADTYYQDYEQANARFLEKVAALVEPGDLVWIHDYQLMLLPGLLRASVPHATIGYFFHIPFPNYDIFKLIPRAWRQALLEGILGADVVGFHTTDYVQHFQQSVSDVLSLPIINQRVVLPDRSVLVQDFPISVDFNKFSLAGQTAPVSELRKTYKRLLRRNRIIFSVDRLDYTKGIRERLLGYERFLIQHPEWHNRVTFVMTVVPSRDKITHYQELKREIEEAVGRINGLFGTIGWRPVVYSYLSLSFEELVALYTGCDVALITPIRDGMNLVAKEFVASRNDGKGVLILSEMAGAARELTEALIINPTDTQEVASAIQQALEMPAREQRERLEKMRTHLAVYDVFRWTYRFLSTLQDVAISEPALQTNLPVAEFVTACQNARNRLLLLDYDGTLTPLVDDPEEALLSEPMRELLVRLSDGNDLVVVSGRSRAYLDRTFGTIPVYLVAEDGAFVKRPGLDGSGLDWEPLSLPQEDWITPIRVALNSYVKEIKGSFLEEKETAITWHYRTARGQEADLRALELATQLSHLTVDIPLSVVLGNKVVEVKPAQHSKGAVARSFFEAKPYDFLVSIGDDTTDEDMFKQLPNWAYTIKIGAGISFARYRLARQQDVEQLLQLLV